MQATLHVGGDSSSEKEAKYISISNITKLYREELRFPFQT